MAGLPVGVLVRDQPAVNERCADRAVPRDRASVSERRLFEQSQLLLRLELEHRENPASTGFPRSNTHQTREGRGAGNEELERVPHAEQRERAEPAAMLRHPSKGDSGEQVRDREQHRWHAPLQAAPSVDGVQQDAGRHEAAKEHSGADAYGPVP